MNKTITQMILNALYVEAYFLGLVLWKSKRWLFRLAIIFVVTYTALMALSIPVANAPKAHAEYYSQPKTEREQIINFITDTFGKDAPQALMIAKCESGLRPNALNDNTTWGGVSQDLGLFQINKKYQGVTNPNFLYNYKINTLMAKQIFDSRGNWSAWSCAKYLGI